MKLKYMLLWPIEKYNVFSNIEITKLPRFCKVKIFTGVALDSGYPTCSMFDKTLMTNNLTY
jgi:hypothetical protein